MSREYIEREAAIKALRDVYEYEYPTASGAFDEYASRLVPRILRNIPSADVVPAVSKDCVSSAKCDCYLWDATAWDVFDRITSAYHGKQYYFQTGNKVYSRDSGKYLTQQEALDEFVERISE